jgi:hypothetical protein
LRRFSSFLTPIFDDIILAIICLPIPCRGRRGRFLTFLVIFGPPKTDFCYIVVSTFFGPSGPPSDPPKSDIFDPPIGAKAQPICGE